MKKLNLYFRLSVIFFFTSLGHLYASFESKIIANVDNQIISSFEFENKIRTILFLSGQEINQVNINNVKMGSLNSLINFKLKKGELLRYKVPTPSSDKANDYLNNVSSKFNTNVDGLKKIFKINELDFETYLDEINVEISWQQLVYDLYNDKIVLDESEINDQLNKLISSQQDIDNFNLAEIEISIDNNLDTDKKIMEIKEEIKNSGFENTAVKFSIAETAFSNGNLGWISSQAMSKKILKIVSAMKVGQISQPIIQSNSILFLKLVNKKSIKAENINLSEMKNRVVNSKKNELLNLFSNNHLSKVKNNALIKIHE